MKRYCKKNNYVLLFSFLLLFTSLPLRLSAQNYDTLYSRLNINKISSLFCNNGILDNLESGSSMNFSIKYPNEQELGYTISGFLVSCLINDSAKTIGMYYHTALTPAGDKKIYRIRKDYKYADLSNELRDGEGTDSEIRNKYESDWQNWKSIAPYKDINKDGIYEPEIDVPGFPDADQTIWFETDDSNYPKVRKYFASGNIGLKIQNIAWAYKDSLLGNVQFRRFKIINSGENDIENGYCSLFADYDIGDGGDDMVGCDTTINLAYFYNRNDYDYIHKDTPPAVGIIYLDGKISSFNPFINGFDPFQFPDTKDYQNSSLKWYNLMRGEKNGKEYYEVPSKFGGGWTKYPFSGDPVTNEGWIDQDSYPQNNRGMNLSVGPFNLKRNEKKEFTFALIAEGGYENINRLEAIIKLKKTSLAVKSFYKSISDTSVSVTDEKVVDNSIPKLLQNYPNPFNPTTLIEYQIPVEGNVKLEIYNSIGQLVSVLVDGYQNAGSQKVTWNGKDSFGSTVATGIYFYRIKTISISQVKKMILIK